MINWRSRLTGIATGDQAIFVTREAFLAVGGFPDLPLMEDIAISQRLKRLCRPFCIGTPVVTSGRRWENNGVWRTILLMWRLRLAYYFGVAPASLAAALRLRSHHPRRAAPGHSFGAVRAYCGGRATSAPSVCAACQPQCGSSRKARAIAIMSALPCATISSACLALVIMPTARVAIPVSRRTRSAIGTLKPGSLGQRLSGVIFADETST